MKDEGVSFRGHLDAMMRGDVPPPPVAELLGIRLVSFGDGEVVFEMDAMPEHANPMGTIQGGVICALADAAMGMAYASRLEEGESFTTLELKANYLRRGDRGQAGRDRPRRARRPDDRADLLRRRRRRRTEGRACDQHLHDAAQPTLGSPPPRKRR